MGRVRELRLLEALFASGDRLVTLLGPAGCGKTRLATRYAALRVRDRAPGDGIWFCGLTEATDAAGVVTCVGQAIGVAVAGDQAIESAAERIGGALAAAGAPLIVLDNCEQVAGEAARLFERWQRAAPEARFLATSRQRLGVVGERCFELGPLALPASPDDVSSSEAVQLFVERARLVRPDYALTGEEAPVVAGIVRALDGLPLAIELAAARMRLMSGGALLGRLDRRFELLDGAGPAGEGHHRTLRAAIDWSWSLLQGWEQAALRQCSVFRGGFTVEAAEAVVDLSRFPGAPGVLDALQSLRDKSLVYLGPSAELPQEMRLGVYESIRAYAAEKLAGSGELDAALARHATHYLDMAGWTRRTNDIGAAEDLRRLTLERENLRAIHERAARHRTDEALRAALALGTLYRHRGPWAAYLAVLDATIERGGWDAWPELLADALRHRGFARRLSGALESARADGERARELSRAARDPYVEGHAERLLWLLDASCPEASASTLLASPRLKAALRAFRRAGSPASEASVHGDMGTLQLRSGRPSAARVCFERALGLADAAGAARTAAMLRIELGVAQQELGLLDEAESTLQRAAGAFLEVGDTLNHLAALYGLGNVRHERGDGEHAERAYQEVIAGMARAGVPTLRSLGLAARGALLAARDDLEEATRALGEAQATVGAVPGAHWRAAVEIHHGHLDLAHARRHAAARAEEASARRRAEARRRLEEGAPLAGTSEDVRMALRWLERALERGAGDRFPPDALVVAVDGAWFRPPHAWRVALGRRAHLRALLVALREARAATPGRPLTREALLRAGWPGERVLARAGASRVYVSILELRDLGLRDLLRSSTGGYLLDPSVRVVTADPPGQGRGFSDV
jgi:predicted ATPase